MTTHVTCAACGWGGPLDTSRTQSSCPNCSNRYDFDTPPSTPRTHIQAPAHASAACGMGYLDIIHRPKYHAFVENGADPTCVACERYAELRKVNDEIRGYYMELVEQILPEDAPARRNAMLFSDVHKAVMGHLEASS